MVTVHLNTPPPNQEITGLRELLHEQFPEAHACRPGDDEDAGATVVTGLSTLDTIGLRAGMLCEAVAERPSLGSALLITEVLRGLATQGNHTVLIDGRDALDPQSLGSEGCQRLLWVRCENAAEAVKSADLLLRDGNLPLVLMDLEWNPRWELGRIPSSSWFRLRNLIETTSATLLVVTPVKLISCAHLRLSLTNTFTVDDLREQERSLAAKYALTVTRNRRDHAWAGTG
ncbi:MAG: hypothetical protein ACI8T1_003772 [Verrucomicrobiales bacterium]|jgi:hypothetical protein